MPRLLMFALLLLLFIGCKSTYVITLNNGTQMISDGKPHLEGSHYVFKDSTGRTNYVNSGRVQAIEAR